MSVTDEQERLMVEIINRLADKFGPHAVLKGGMVLRLLDCPRLTNDLDYVFVPYRSKNEIAERVVATLRTIPDAKVTWTVNSKCLRCIVAQGDVSVQVEAQVAADCESTELSTAQLSRMHGTQGRVIRAMSLGQALAHKLAAWNERRLMRDLYDIYFLSRVLNAKIDRATLIRRLAKIESRRPKSTNKAGKMTLEQFTAELRKAATELSDREIAAELRDTLSATELAGLELKIRIALNLLSEELGDGSQ